MLILRQNQFLYEFNSGSGKFTVFNDYAIYRMSFKIDVAVALRDSVRSNASLLSTQAADKLEHNAFSQ